MEDDTAETIEVIMEEATTVLASNDDSEFRSFAEIEKLWVSVQSNRQAREEAICSEIQALMTRKDAAREQLDLTRGDIQTELVRLQTESQEAVKKQQQIRKEVEALQKEQITQKKEQEHLEEQRQKLEMNTSTTLPSIRHDINLYSYLTGIRWQYDCAPNEVKGYVAGKDRVQTFNLNTEKNSQFFITNCLWDMIEADW